MADTPASDNDSDLEREYLADDKSAGEVDAASARPTEETSAASAAPRRTLGAHRPRSNEQASRRSGWIRSVGALVAAALVVTLISYVLMHLAPSRASLGDSPAVTPSLTALATTTAATTATDTATVTPHATVTPAGLGSGGRPTPGFTVQSIPAASVSFDTDGGVGMATDSGAPIPSATGGCGPHVIFWVTFTVNLSNNPNPPNQPIGANVWGINYFFQNSDGSSDGSISHLHYEPLPGGGTGMTVSTKWQIPYAQATGVSQWTELDIEQPNKISYKANFSALCAFSLTTPVVSVNPTTYNCATGGDQTFTETGTIRVTLTPDNTSHTVSYFWENDYSTHGTTSATQTVTFPPGVTSMPAQPDTVTGNAANQTAAFQVGLYVNYDGSQFHDFVTVTSAC